MAPTRTMDDTAGRAPARRASGVAAAARAPTSTIAPRAASARPVLGSSTSVNARALPRRSRDSPYTGATRAGPSKSTTTGGTSHVPSVKDATVASLLTREKERLAEEVHELRRRHASMEERLKLANAESARAATELRRRDRTIATLESAEGDGRRVARIAELEAENDAYASEVTRLAAILCFARDDDDDDAATASNESSRAEARLRAQLALGPTMGKGHADGVEDELVEAKRRAETLAARVERLERDEASARRRAEAFERETEDARAERDALRAEVRRLEEDNDHLRRLAAMEAAAASSARDDARLAEAECARTKPALASLRRQLAAVGERLARERGGANAEEAIDTILAAAERRVEGGKDGPRRRRETSRPRCSRNGSTRRRFKPARTRPENDPRDVPKEGEDRPRRRRETSHPRTLRPQRGMKTRRIPTTKSSSTIWTRVGRQTRRRRIARRRMRTKIRLARRGVEGSDVGPSRRGVEASRRGAFDSLP